MSVCSWCRFVPYPSPSSALIPALYPACPVRLCRCLVKESWGLRDWWGSSPTSSSTLSVSVCFCRLDACVRRRLVHASYPLPPEKTGGIYSLKIHVFREVFQVRVGMLNFIGPLHGLEALNSDENVLIFWWLLEGVNTTNISGKAQQGRKIDSPTVNVFPPRMWSHLHRLFTIRDLPRLGNK